MKLNNFPKILWINLERSIERREYMEELLNKNNLMNVRIVGIDGMNKEELEKICIKNDSITDSENACTCSHLIALKYFIENTDENEIIIFEDDVSFEFLNLIPYNWSELINNFPKKYDIIQLAVSSSLQISNKLIKISVKNKYFGTVAYLITRDKAINILDEYYNDKINLKYKENPTSDNIIISDQNTYCIPIFSYKVSDSTIHTNDLIFQRRSKKQQYNAWLNLKNIDINKYFNEFEIN